MAGPWKGLLQHPHFARTNAKNIRLYLSGMSEIYKKKRTNIGPLHMPSDIQRYPDAFLQGCGDTVGALKVKRFF